jgi:uncharacterized protein YegL
MKGSKIAQLNAGLRDLERDLRNHDLARDRVQLAVLRVDSNVTVVADWVDAADFTAPVLEASGLTALGEAVATALTMIEDRKQIYRQSGITYTRPWLFIMTDGEPNDKGWEQKASLARSAEAAGKVVIRLIGVEGANTHELGLFSQSGEVFSVGEVDFHNLFVWISASLSQVSSTAAGEAVQIAAPPGRSIQT